jgi:GTP cyclohydrolase IA
MDSQRSNGATHRVLTPEIEDIDHANSGDSSIVNEGHKKKRKNKEKRSKENGHKSRKRRRYSISKAARDPRDEASPIELGTDSRSPSPVIDFDGLSRPSTFPTCRIEGAPHIYVN